MDNDAMNNDAAAFFDRQVVTAGDDGATFQPSWEIQDPDQGPASLPATSEAIHGGNSSGGPKQFGGGRTNSIGVANRPRLSLDLAAARIAEHGRGLTSERFPASQLRVEGGRIIARDHEFRLEGQGLRRLCGELGAPFDYLANRLSPELRDDALEYHLRSGGATRRGINDANSRILSRNGDFVGLGRADLHTLGGDAVLRAVRDGFEGDAPTMEVQDLHIQDEAFRLDIVSPAVSNEVRPGDVIQAGVRVEHALTGESATTVMAFVVRLLCSNGMVHRECLGSRRTARTRRLDAARQDAEPLQLEQIRNLVVQTRQGLAEKLAAIGRLAQERADEHQLEQFLRRARMHSGSLMDQLRQAWAIEGGEQTAFGLFNALTHLATHGTELSGRQRAALARLAGIYANRNAHLCPHCFSVLT